MHKRNMKVRRFYPRQVFNRLRKRQSGAHTTGEMHALWFFMHRANWVPRNAVDELTYLGFKAGAKSEVWKGNSPRHLFLNHGPRLELVDGVVIHNVLTGTFKSFKLRRNGEDEGRAYLIDKGQSSYEFVANVKALMNSSLEN